MLEYLKNRIRFQFVFTVVVSWVFCVTASSQCPINIDFEEGDFNLWTCYAGSFSNGNLLLSPSPVLPTRHRILSSVPGDGLDYWGGFPKNCPNGSGHSIQLGDSLGGGKAEGVSYTFTIPAGQTKFSLIYSYAIVLQDFGHTPDQQPRLIIDIKDLTTDAPVPCASLNFVVDEHLPGFFISPKSAPDLPVRYKDWSSQSVNLDNLDGHIIQISFTTTDCAQTVHFGYAYIDIDSDCTSSFKGSKFCTDDTAVNVFAPYGYQGYKWFNSANQVIGTQQVLNIKPPPPNGTVVSVELTPYNGYGCVQTLSCVLTNDLKITANAGPDKEACYTIPVQIGSLPQPGLVYNWTPVTGLSNTGIANPFFKPPPNSPLAQSLALQVRNTGGGCAAYDTVIVTIPAMSDTVELAGNAAMCRSDAAAAYLKVFPAGKIQWYLNGKELPGENSPVLANLQTGDYYAVLTTSSDCSLQTQTRHIEVYPVPVPDFSVQTVCRNLLLPVTNRTVNNTQSAVNYFWDFGNGQTGSGFTPAYAYTVAGSYTVKLKVNTAQCPLSFDSVSKNVIIENELPGITYPGKDAVFNFPEPLRARNIGNRAEWTPATSLSNRNSYNPVFKGLSPVLYTVQLTSAAGCVTIDTQLVKTHKKIEIFVPSAFTPGNDNVNERLHPVLMGFAKVNYFRIYNRQGRLLFSMNSDQPGWDGTLNGIPLDTQTVVWMLEAVDVDGKVHYKQGTTVMLR